MLDHGCASGATMLPFRDAGWGTFGIDPHLPSVETGVKEFGLDIREAGGEKLPFDDGTFDLVMSLGSLEHVYDLDATMTECWRVLKDGASLLIRWRSNVMWGSPYEYYNHNHYRYFTRKTWTMVLLRYGFQVIDMTDREVEGYTGAEYIVAQKAQPGTLNEVHDAIKMGEQENPANCVAALEKYKTEFAGRCEKFIVFADSVGADLEAIVKGVQEKRVNYRLLWGDPEVTVPRAILEAKRFLEERAIETATGSSSAAKIT
jgi:SAM-dependent methyltransferase